MRAPTSSPDHSVSVDASGSRAAASSSSTRCAPMRAATSRRRRVGGQVVEAVHEQHRVATRGDDPVDHRAEAGDGGREIAVGIETAGREVALGQLPGAHRRAVGCASTGTAGPACRARRRCPANRRRGRARTRPGAAGAARDDRTNRGRSRPPTPVRARRQPRGPCNRLRTWVSPPGNKRVGLHVPGSGREPTRCSPATSSSRRSRPHLEVVLEHDGLTVEHEAETGIGGEQVEHRVDRVDEPAAEDLERAVPLPIPVEVGDEQNFGDFGVTPSHRDDNLT